MRFRVLEDGSMDFYASEDGKHFMCSWWAWCDNVATLASRGPIGNGEFGMIPVCERCATRFELPTVEYAINFEED